MSSGEGVSAGGCVAVGADGVEVGCGVSVGAGGGVFVGCGVEVGPGLVLLKVAFTVLLPLIVTKVEWLELSSVPLHDFHT